MKKILTGLVALTTLFSCSMDRMPEGSISDKESLITATDYEKFSIGLHSTMRTITSGDYVVLSDIQFDDFNAVLGNGNRRMEFYNGQVQPSTGEIASIYSGFYTMIAQANFLLDQAVEKLAAMDLYGTDSLMVERAAGQAYFFRAFCYNALADRFCPSYIHCTNRDKEGSGLSLQLTYAPTADSSKYPGRSSLEATYEQIISDLMKAIAMLEDYEKKTNTDVVATKMYVSSNAAKALLARVYLNAGNYELAINYAEQLLGVNGPKYYDLISDKKEYYNMWLNDEGKEIIWLVSGDYSYHGSSTGAAFCNNEQNPDYIPTNDAIYLFEVDDNRWYAWFENDDINNKAAKMKKINTNAGSADMFLFAKYPGNPKLQETSATGSNFVNLMKPLRISEMYLIAAEAYFMINNEPKAKEYLRQIETARNSGRYNNDLAGTKLIEEIHDERHREFMGEGMRQADLKRWNIGFTRSDAFDGNNSVTVPNFRNISYEAGDYRFTWPIPQHEMDMNPQLKNQQNEGYETVK